MEKIKTKIKKWGNSFGIILPKKLINTEEIKEGTEVIINIETDNHMTVKDLMEFAKRHPLKFKRKTKEALEEVDKELWLDR